VKKRNLKLAGLEGSFDGALCLDVQLCTS
jgi:hypothetical protein